MAYENLCMYCFKDSGGENICPHCGKDARAAVPQIQLLPGTTVYRGRFLVGRALGQDTNGIVYTALDTKRGGTIRIREYLPRNCADRLGDGNVVPVPGMEDAFDAGMKKLRASVEGVDDPSKRHFYFEENGTAYIAQRKGSAAASSAMDDDDDDYRDEGHGHSVALYIAIAAAVVVALAIGIIWFLSSMDDPDDITLNNPLPTQSLVQATWKPEATPSPTPYVAPTFAALVDPELSWMEYTYPGNVDKDYQNQVQQQPTRTPEPVVDTTPQYSTINKNSSAKEIATLQTMLAQYGWMDVSDVNGKYDSNTVQAVKDFQSYVNEYCNPSRKLSVDGIAGQKTLQWLLDSSVSITKPTPTPTPLVTISPNDLNVSAGSPKSDIKAVQNKLIVLSLLPEGSADGIYGNSTRQAVVDFQVRVNQLQGYNALEISGTVDPLTMAYLNYYVEWWQEKQEQQQPQETEVPQTNDTVNSTSSRAEVAEVQELLAGVGLLRENQIDGAYGLATAEAVAHFQQWVNQMCNEHTLNVSGEVDTLTRRYLEYCIQNNMRVQDNTETPEPTLKPVEIPTEAPEPDENNVVINADSPKESIKFVQELLAAIGLLEDSGIDGDYGRGTRRAVSTLQEYVNTKKGAQVLEVTGECDALTLQYLEYCSDHEIDVAAEIAEWNATPAPTQEPTKEPTREPTKEPTREPTQAPTREPEIDESNVTVNPDSPKEAIEYVQEMLAAIGLIEPEGVDGDYGSSTKKAVSAFQQFVNDEKREQVLDVTGLCNALTLQYLEYCYDNEWDVAGMIASKDATPEPTQQPQQPTQAPDPVDRVINAASPVEDIAYVQQMLAGVGLIEEDDIDGDYGRGTESAVTLFQQYVNWKQGDQVLEITGECDALTLQYLEYCFDKGWDVAGEIAGATATKAPTQEPTREPEAEVGTIRNFRVVIDGMETYGGTTILQPGTHSITWLAEGDVSGYFLYLYDENNKLLNSAEHTSKTGFELDTSSMKPERVYTLHVGALPVNGGEDDVSWHTIQLMCEAQPTQEPTPKPTQKPTAGKPAINIGSSVYQKDGIAYINDDSIIFSWMADGQVESYTVYLLYEDGTQFSLGETGSTSKTVSASQLQPGKYKLYVGAKPIGGSDDDIVWNNLPFVMPAEEATQAPAAKPTQMPEDLPLLQLITSRSKPEDILRMQTFLYAYGLIPLDTQEGVLDEYTIYAVITFQQKVNEVLGANIIPIVDPTAEGFSIEDFTVDEITLAYLQDPSILGLSAEDFIVG